MSAAELPMGQMIFSLGEVARLTGFSQRSIEDGCRRGIIAHQRFGRQRNMTRRQVVAFLAAAEVEVKVKSMMTTTEDALFERDRQRAARAAARSARARRAAS